MTSFVHDLRHSLRLLAKSPAFALVAILMIALGIGANTAIFSVVNAVLLRPLPYPGADRLVVLMELSPSRVGRMSVALPNLYDWQAQTRLYDGFSAYRAQTFILTGVDTPGSLPGREVSSGFFHVLGVQPVLGRNFTPADDQPNAPGVAILSYGAWKSRFGGDPGIIGKKLILNSEPAIVTGVLPSSFQFGSRRDEVFIPLSRMAVNPSALDRGNHGGLFVLARLEPGVSLSQADAEIKTIARRLEKQYPLSNTGNSAQAMSLNELWVGNVRPILLMLLGAVGFVLLIACANVANLLLARSAARRREVAIRAALGAGSWRIARQLLTESLLLSCLGGALGLMLALWGISGLHNVLPAGVPRLKDAGVDLWVLGFAVAASVVTGVVFGLAPALQARRTDFNEALKAGGRAATMDGRRHRLRRLLLVTEIALALVLSVGAGLMTRSAMRARAVNPGFDPHNLLTMFVSLPGAQYRENARQIAFFDQVLDRMRALPGVRSASLSICLPIDGSCWGSVFVIEGRPLPKRSELWQSQWNVAGKDYFETMRIRLLRGRTFRASDVAGAPNVVVINETAARKFFPGEDPIGKRVRQGWPEWAPRWREIVGVVGDVKQDGLDADQLPEIFLPFAQAPSQEMSMTLRTEKSPGSLTSAVRGIFHDLDRDVPVYRIHPMEELIDESLAPRTLSMLLLGLFAALALLLAAFGIYSVISYSITQRTQEIGVRMALGAGEGDVVRMVLREAGLVAVMGIAIGLAAALALTRLIAGLLFDLSSTDPVSFAGTTVLLAMVALAAGYIPARRAARVDPAIALRQE